jgi:hypothetical protein
VRQWIDVPYDGLGKHDVNLSSGNCVLVIVIVAVTRNTFLVQFIIQKTRNLIFSILFQKVAGFESLANTYLVGCLLFVTTTMWARTY